MLEPGVEALVVVALDAGGHVPSRRAAQMRRAPPRHRERQSARRTRPGPRACGPGAWAALSSAEAAH